MNVLYNMKGDFAIRNHDEKMEKYLQKLYNAIKWKKYNRRRIV